MKLFYKNTSIKTIIVSDDVKWHQSLWHPSLANLEHQFGRVSWRDAKYQIREALSATNVEEERLSWCIITMDFAAVPW